MALKYKERMQNMSSESPPGVVEMGIEFMMGNGNHMMSDSAAPQWHCENARSGHTMLEVMVDVGKDHVTLRRVTSGQCEVEIPVLTADAQQQMMWDASSQAGDQPHRLSSSFRESITKVGTMVRQLSHDLTRHQRNTSKVQNSSEASMGSEAFAGIFNSAADPENGQGMMRRTRSGAEYALEGLRFINKATATADQKKSWEQVEARFHRLANADFMLSRANFAECIGVCARARVCVLFVPIYDKLFQTCHSTAAWLWGLEIWVRRENCEEGRKSHKLMHYLPLSHPRASSFYLYVDITLAIS